MQTKYGFLKDNDDDNINRSFFFSTHFFLSSHMYPENPEGTQVIVGSVMMTMVDDVAEK